MTPLLALLGDRILGEPPLRLHPVVWMGRFLSWGSRTIPGSDRAAFLKGSGLWCLGFVLCLAAGFSLERLIAPAGPWAPVLSGLIAVPFLSLRLLVREVEEVEHALAGGIEAGRTRLSRIVSRDTTRLTEVEVRESALESLSENLTDSVTAPLFWLLVLGLPGIVAYRFANTADAMWGYRDHREWFGKWAAHADDALNWIPARLTGLVLCPIPLWSRLPRQSRIPPSPNGGWTMGALALALNVRLGKPGVYVLNPSAPTPGTQDTRRGLKLVVRTAWVCAALLSLLELAMRLHHA
jgi:adenosylcobinamide-phosphate synthase